MTACCLFVRARDENLCGNDAKQLMLAESSYFLPVANKGLGDLGCLYFLV